MATHKCKRGWITVPSSINGDPVPFFVKVRDKDIVNTNKYDKNILSIIENKGENTIINNTGNNIITEIDNWKIKITPDGEIEMNIKVDFQSITKLVSNEELFSRTVPFPFELDEEYEEKSVPFNENIFVSFSLFQKTGALNHFPNMKYDLLKTYDSDGFDMHKFNALTVTFSVPGLDGTTTVDAMKSALNGLYLSIFVKGRLAL